MAETLKRKFTPPLSWRTITALIIVAGLHTFATWYSWYSYWPWFDIPMHMLGGFFIASAFLDIFVKKGRLQAFNGSRIAGIILCISFVILIGALWEFFEFGVDRIIGKPYMSLGLFDTLKDLADDLIGGFTCAVVAYFGKSYRTTAPSSSAHKALSSSS